MACGCIKKIFDLYVTYTDCKHIVLEDQSVWMGGAGYEKPEFIEVTIRSESRGTEITKDLYLNKRNIYSSIDLFYSTEKKCLLDDIYCFSVISCENTYKVSRAYLCNTLCKIDQLVSRAKTTADYDQITLLKRMAEGVEINTRIGKIEAAKELLKDLTKKLDHLTCGHCN